MGELTLIDRNAFLSVMLGGIFAPIECPIGLLAVWRRQCDEPFAAMFTDAHFVDSYPSFFDFRFSISGFLVFTWKFLVFRFRQNHVNQKFAG
jgi:hypothetical protein